MSLETKNWVGTELAGRYQILSELDEGGMALVYLALDRQQRRKVVVKTPRPALLADRELVGRFTREGNSLVRLTHPHIVNIVDFGVHREQPFLVMDFLAGGSLRKRIERGRRAAPADLRLWLPDIAAALDFCHASQYIHRDVKPDNILFDADDKSYLSDFGIVKLMSPSPSAKATVLPTSTGMTIGTAHYMAPELIIGRKFDRSVDQYAIAATVYECLAGRTPYLGDNMPAVAVEQQTKDAPRLETVNPAVPKKLADAVHRALAKDPAQRFANCTAFAKAVLARLPRAAEPTPVVNAPPTMLERTSVSCPQCHKQFNVPPNAMGKKLRCPSCKASIPPPARPAETVLESGQGTDPGHPPVRSPRMALAFTAFAAAILGGIGVWAALHLPVGTDRKDVIGQKDPPPEIKVAAVTPTPGKNDGIGQKDPPPTPEKKYVIDQKDPPPPEIKVAAVTPTPEPVAYGPANMKQVAVGQYVPNGAKEPAILLQARSENGGWSRLLAKDITSGRRLLSLPGSRNVLALDSGVELTLWGNLYELTFNPMFYESRAIVHSNDLLDADITHERGRIVLRNNKKVGADANCRVRFNNPQRDAGASPVAEEEYVDITLQPGAAVMLERFSEWTRDEPFYDNPKDKMRLGPTAKMVVHAYKKGGQIRYKQVRYALDEKQLPVLVWRSRGGDLAPPPAGAAKSFPVISAPPLEPAPLKDKTDQMVRDKVIKAHVELVQLLEKREFDIALAEYIQSVQKASERDAAKQISPDTYFRWIHVIRCYAAVDDVGFLFGEFSADPTPFSMRGIYMFTLQKWTALGRDNDYLLLDVVKKNYGPTESINIMHLFHMISVEKAAKPETYENLIEGLNNDLMPIRMLSYSHLVGLVPEGANIAYDPAASRQVRLDAARAWTALIPPGKLPPRGEAPKKDKAK